MDARVKPAHDEMQKPASYRLTLCRF